MSLFICEELLKDLLNRTDIGNIAHAQCVKELSIIKKIQSDALDFKSPEELEGKCIYLLNKDEYDKMVDKSIRYDAIAEYIKGKTCQE